MRVFLSYGENPGLWNTRGTVSPWARERGTAAAIESPVNKISSLLLLASAVCLLWSGIACYLAFALSCHLQMLGYAPASIYLQDVAVYWLCGLLVSGVVVSLALDRDGGAL